MQPIEGLLLKKNQIMGYFNRQGKTYEKVLQTEMLLIAILGENCTSTNTTNNAYCVLLMYIWCKPNLNHCKQ